MLRCKWNSNTVRYRSLTVLRVSVLFCDYSSSWFYKDENRNIRPYKIKIDKIIKDKKSDRDMVIKVVDEDLIDYTGGIVQGMSGIPIIQNNKLIGSITHVFKNNPKKGYGIFIHEMIQWENRE